MSKLFFQSSPIFKLSVTAIAKMGMVDRGFALPLFRTSYNNQYYYTQIIDDNKLITDFTSIEIDDSSIVNVDRKSVVHESISKSVAIGDKGIFGFYHNEDSIFISDHATMKVYLRRYIDQCAEFPFLKLEISQFLEDEEEIKLAIDNLSKKMKFVSNISLRRYVTEEMRVLLSSLRDRENRIEKETSSIIKDTVSEWGKIRARLRVESGEEVYQSWFRSLTLISRDGEVVTHAVPSRVVRDRIAEQHGSRLLALWREQDPAITRVEIIVSGAVEESEKRAIKPEPSTEHAAAATSELLVSQPGRIASAAEALSAPLDPRFTFTNFVVGKPNELAFAAARRVAESEAVPFNPLFLYGGVGLGKTHLMHAIAWNLRQRYPQRRVLYISAEKFMYQFIRALRFKDTVAFKEQFRSVDVLIIDDVQFISGKDSTQEEFFHTFNALVDQNRQVIISADKSPNDLDGLEERLRSRLGWGLVADIHPTTYELRLGILQAKAERLAGSDAAIPPKVLEFLAHKIASNVRELEGALNRIVAHSTLVGRSITLESTQEVLHDLLKANDRRVSIEEIQRRVAAHFYIRIADMHSARRSRAIARPRQVAMYLTAKLTQRSLSEIGRKFGGRDSTTVAHAIRKVTELRMADRHFDEDVDLLWRMLES